MKKNILLTILLILSHTLVSAQHYTWTERTSAGSRNWTAVASSANGAKLVAVSGESLGFVYTSMDSGITWNTQSSFPLFSWGSVSTTADGAISIACIQKTDYIYAFANSGAWYSPLLLSGERKWSAAAVSANGSRIVAADASPGYIYTSVDSGYHWSAQTSSGSRKWRVVVSSYNGASLAAVHDSIGYIYTSSNYGITWNAQTSAGAKKWSTVATSADGLTLVAANGTPGYIYISTDTGATWTAQTVVGSRKWSCVSTSLDGTTIVAVDGSPGYMYISTNSGATWTTQTTAGSRVWTSVAVSADGKKVVACASNGYLYTGVYIPNSIATSSFSDTSYCQGTSLFIPFTTLGVYDSTNIFTAQLSDSAGSFDAPIAIGTRKGTANDTITATLPPSIPPGNSYRIRVMSSSPVTTGAANAENIIIHATPALFTVTGGGGYCVGDTGVVIGLSNSQLGVRYQLQKNGIDTLSPQEGTGESINFGTQTDAGAYSVLAIDITTGCTLLQGNVKVSVYPVPPKPTITRIGNELSSSSTTGNLWFLNNQHLGGVTSKTYTPTTSGKYSVRATLNICVSPMSEVIDFIVDTEKVTAGFNASITKGDAPFTVAFTDATSGNPTSWSWDFGDTQSSAKQNPTHTYTKPGNYTVKLTASNAATNDTKSKEGFIIVQDPSGVTNDGSGIGSNTDKKLVLQSIPNPVSGEAVVSIESSINTTITLCLYNLLGNKVLDIYDGEIKSGQTDFRFTVTDSATGAYYLLAKYPHGTAIELVQVMK